MNCKSGDLAIQAKSSAGNEGAIVLVEEFVGPVIDYENALCWKVKDTHPINVRTIFGIRPQLEEEIIYCPDDWLKPISGIPDNVDVDIEETITEKA